PSPQIVATDNSNMDRNKGEAQHHQEAPPHSEAPPHHETAAPKQESTSAPGRTKPLETLRRSPLAESASPPKEKPAQSDKPRHAPGVQSVPPGGSSLPAEAGDILPPAPFNVPLEMESGVRPTTHASAESRQIRLPIENSPEGTEVRLRGQAGNIEVS